MIAVRRRNSFVPLLLIVLAVLLMVASRVVASVTVSGGYRTVTPEADSRVIYVAANGSDSNNGLSSGAPKLTLAAAWALVRTGFPDQILLRRGDTWNESFPRLRKSGRSAGEPILIGAYGTNTSARPIVIAGSGYNLNCALEMQQGSGVNRVDHLVIQSLDIRSSVANAAYGLWLYMAGSNLTIEDCKFSGFGQGISGYDDAPSGTYTPSRIIYGITINKCVFVDNSNLNAPVHQQAIYLSNYGGTLNVTSNIFIHNGVPTIRSHQVYLDDARVAGVTVNFTDNIILGETGSSHGAQIRDPRGNITGNFLWRQAIGIQAGTGGVSQGGGTDMDPLEDLWTNMSDNVILDSIDIDASNPRGWGLYARWLADATPGSTIARNLVARSTGNYKFGLIFDDRSLINRNVTILDNVFYNVGGIAFADVAAGFDDITIDGNKVRESTTYVPLIQHDGTPTTTVFDSLDNSFYSLAGQAGWFEVAGAGRSFTQWKTAVGDTTSTAAASATTGFTTPNWTPRDLLTSISISTADVDAAYDELATRLSAQRRYSWDDRLDAIDLCDGARAAFGMSTIGGTPNALPVGEVGLAQTITDSDRNGVQAVTMQGAATDSDGTIASSGWTNSTDGAFYSGGAAVITLPLGVHTLTYVATDDDGATSLPLTTVVTIRANSVTGVSAVANSSGGTVTWNAYTGAGDYLVEYGTSSGVYTLSSAAQTNTISISGSVGTTYYGTIKARKNGATGVATSEWSFTVPTPTNTPPVANAGPDQTVTAGGGGTASVVFTGAGSSDSDGTIVSYQWDIESITQSFDATGVNPTVALPPATYTAFLTVTDDDGATATDTMTVVVQPNTPGTKPAKVSRVSLLQYQNGGGLKVVWPTVATATGYTVRWTRVSTGVTTQENTTSTTLNIANLARNARYAVTVTAYNAAGAGTVSDTVYGTPRRAPRRIQERRRRHQIKAGRRAMVRT